MAVITFLNLKGGCGKSTACYHLSGALSNMGRRVLLVDNDPQSSLSQAFWGSDATRQLEASETIASIYAGEEPFPGQVIRPTSIKGVDLLAGSRHATQFNVPLPHLAEEQAQVGLREFLNEVRGDYDHILIDNPPNLHCCSWASLIASDHIVIPLRPDHFSAQGLVEVHESINLVLATRNPALELCGYLLTMCVARRAIHQAFETSLRQQYGDSVLATKVAESVDFVESLNDRVPVGQFKPRSAAAKSMKALAEEIELRLANGLAKGAA